MKTKMDKNNITRNKMFSGKNASEVFGEVFTIMIGLLLNHDQVWDLLYSILPIREKVCL